MWRNEWFLPSRRIDDKVRYSWSLGEMRCSYWTNKLSSSLAFPVPYQISKSIMWSEWEELYGDIRRRVVHCFVSKKDDLFRSPCNRGVVPEFVRLLANNVEGRALVTQTIFHPSSSKGLISFGHSCLSSVRVKGGNGVSRNGPSPTPRERGKRLLH